MPGLGRRPSLSPEERQARSVSAKRKFRAIVRLIVANLTWLQEIDDDRLGDNVRKNIQVLTRKKGKKSVLTLHDKAVLNKAPELRTGEEVAHLRNIIGSLKCFRRFPREVKDQLPEIMYFAYFGPNRVILKQDYQPLNMYVILSGEVMVSQTYYNKLLKRDVTNQVLVIGPGNYFGEVSLLQEINRLATVTTTQDSEFLYVRKEDFDRVLKDSVQELWTEIESDLYLFSYFKKWSWYDIRECCILARKKSYETDQMILSATGGQHDCVYFITKGWCYLVEYMTIKTEYKNGIYKYTLLEEDEDDRPTSVIAKDIKKLYKSNTSQVLSKHMLLRPPIYVSTPSFTMPTTRKHYMKVCSFNKLACFNVGETLRHRVVVAATETDCLLLPKYFLLGKDPFTFKTVEQFLKNHIPPTQKIFQSFMEERKWRRYKQHLFDTTLRRTKGLANNNVHNVPYSIRLAEYLGNI